MSEKYKISSTRESYIDQFCCITTVIGFCLGSPLAATISAAPRQQQLFRFFRMIIVRPPLKTATAVAVKEEAIRYGSISRS